MLAFSVTCSNCNRSFVDIDESLIGQLARCKCGSVAKLDPDWNFKPAKANHARLNGNYTPATEIKNAASATKTKSSDNQPLKSKKRQPTKQSRPADSVTSTKAATKAQKSTTTSEPLVFDNYSDLEKILSSGVDRTPLELTRVDSPFVEQAPVAKPNRKGMIGAITGGLAGILTALGLLTTRLFSFDGTPLGWIGHALYGTYTASLGSGEMTPAIKNMFTGIGWWLLLLAVLIGCGSVLLLCRATIRISTGRKTLAWSRGFLATLSVISLFSLLGLIFIETIHHGNLIHYLDSFSKSAPVQGLLEPPESSVTFEDVRKKYNSERTEFQIGVLTFAILPLITFGGVAASLLFDER